MEPIYVEIAAAVGAVLLLVVVGFEALPAWGLPLGEAAWGGRHRVLPRHLRIASAAAAAFWLAVVLLERGGVLAVGLDPSVTRIAVWALTPFLAVGVLLNASSRSKKERLWAPVVGVLFGASLFLVVVS